MIYFIRHGESEANLKQEFAGQKDNSLLTEKGRRQAKEGGVDIINLGLKINKIISSPLERTKDTAKIIADVIGYKEGIIIDPRIIEYDMGSLTGTRYHEISSKILVSAENAEDPMSFHDRVKSFLDDWKNKDETILMVCHAGVGRMIESIKQNRDPRLFYDIQKYPNGKVIKLDWLE